MPAAAACDTSPIELALDEAASWFDPRVRETVLRELRGKHLTELELILERLPRPGSVLDVGGGMGVNLLALRALLGADVRLSIIDRFDEYTDENPMGAAATGIQAMRAESVEVVEQDFWPDPALPWDDGEFDVVTCLDVVEHLPGSPVPLLRESRRVLRRGGWIVTSGPNALALLTRAKLALGRHPYSTFDLWVADRYYSHFREYAPGEHRHLLELAGFEGCEERLSREPTLSRLRHRFFHGRDATVLDTARLAVLAAGEAAVPTLRPAVHAVGRKP